MQVSMFCLFFLLGFRHGLLEHYTQLFKYARALLPQRNFNKSPKSCAIKQMVNVTACTIQLQMHLGGLLSTQEARVALGYRLVRLLRIFRA